MSKPRGASRARLTAEGGEFRVKGRALFKAGHFHQRERRQEKESSKAHLLTPSKTLQSRAHTVPMCPESTGPLPGFNPGVRAPLFVSFIKTLKQNEHVSWHFSALPAAQVPPMMWAERKQHPSREGAALGCGRNWRVDAPGHIQAARFGSNFPGLCGEVGGREGADSGAGMCLDAHVGAPPPILTALDESSGSTFDDSTPARRPVIDFLVSHPH